MRIPVEGKKDRWPGLNRMCIGWELEVARDWPSINHRVSFIRLSSQFFFCSVVSSIERVNLVGRPLVGYVLFDRCTPPRKDKFDTTLLV